MEGKFKSNKSWKKVLLEKALLSTKGLLEMHMIMESRSKKNHCFSLALLIAKRT